MGLSKQFQLTKSRPPLLRYVSLSSSFTDFFQVFKISIQFPLNIWDSRSSVLFSPSRVNLELFPSSYIVYVGGWVWWWEKGIC